ncbi:MAG: hypothetical protein P4L46_14585 [Fimbriimonas sp.]|nr:hypothetical protein [Fimbriimonas sp.]
MKAVSLFMDVEDPINPLADDAALDFPRLFADQGVRGSFCLTGEKCRTLKQRSRIDVAEAYKPHALGLHTNRHSFHPTTMELLADLSFDEGCEAAYSEERQGFEAFCDLFGRNPIFWGGGGNTWSPEITDTLKRLGVPAYAYAMTELPDHAVHEFNGVLALPQALSISETDWADDRRASEAVERVLRSIETIDQPWIGVFVGHPTKFRHNEYWDKPYYFGRTPAEPEFVQPVSDDVYKRSKYNLREFLGRIKEIYRVIGVDDTVRMDWRFETPSTEDFAHFESRTSASLRGATGWPPHRLGLSADKIVDKTMNLKHTLRRATLS